MLRFLSQVVQVKAIDYHYQGSGEELEEGQQELCKRKLHRFEAA